MSGDKQAGWLSISTADQSNVLAALQGADTIQKKIFEPQYHHIKTT